jgi:hypothetical protein
VSVTNETIVGEHNIDGAAVQVQRTTWRGRDGAAYDLLDAVGKCLTEESFTSYPTPAQMRAVLRGGPVPRGTDTAGPYCRFCTRATVKGGHLIGAAEPGTNAWCCDACWDPRLA